MHIKLFVKDIARPVQKVYFHRVRQCYSVFMLTNPEKMVQETVTYRGGGLKCLFHEYQYLSGFQNTRLLPRSYLMQTIANSAHLNYLLLTTDYYCNHTVPLPGESSEHYMFK